MLPALRNNFGEWLSSAVLTGVSLPRPFIRYFWAESSQTDETRIAEILRTVGAGSPRSW